MNQWDQVLSEAPRTEFSERVWKAVDAELSACAASSRRGLMKWLMAPMALTAIGFVIFNVWRKERTEDMQDIILMSDLEDAIADSPIDENLALLGEDLEMLEDLEVLEEWKTNS